MIQKLIEKLNKKRLKERISSAIVMVALIVSISGVVGAVSGIVVNNRYNYALKNYGFSQGDIGKMMITFADTRSYLRASIGYQDENLVNSCVENYEKKKESCQQYTKEVKNTVSSSDEEKIYSSITEKLTEYYEICDAVLEKGKNTQDIDARHEAQQMAQDQVAPIYEQIYQDFCTYYGEHCMDATEPYPGVPSLLDWLKKAGYQTAIVSNKADFAVKKLNRIYLLEK